ncbi:MAG: AI-2E family transporter [Deltaproteobacteria bacterium]|nr:AI-2E family transporter [Deltaproteobacteria bacterium]
MEKKNSSQNEPVPTPTPPKFSDGKFRPVLVAAAIVVILAGLRVAAPVFVPFLLAAFVAMLCSVPLFWLHRRGVPNGLSVMLVVVMLLIGGTLLGLTVGSSMKGISSELPTYREKLVAHSGNLFAWLESRGVDTSQYRDSVTDLIQPKQAMGVATTALKSISNILTDGFMILLTVIFILLEAMGMPKKLRKVLDDPDTTFKGFEQFLSSVKKYLVIKTLISAATGLIIGITLWLLGIDFPVLWGLLAFAFNFVPTIGSIIAAIPPLIVGVVQVGPEAIASVGLTFLITNVVMGNVIEPRVMGEGLGLSTLVVFLSLVFWGWLLGPVGMLLSVPLTMIVKIACQSSTSLKHIGILLGPTPK